MCYPVIPVAASNDISRMDIIREDNKSVAAWAAGLFYYVSDKLSPFVPQPEGETGSKGALNDIPYSCVIGDIEFAPALGAAHMLHCPITLISAPTFPDQIRQRPLRPPRSPG